MSDGHDNEYTDVDVTRKAEHARRVMADYLRAGRAIGALWFDAPISECDDETLSLQSAGVRNLEGVEYGIWRDGDLIGIVYQNGARVMCALGLGERFVARPGELKPAD